MQANRRRTDDPLMAQRAIIRQVLRHDHRDRWSLRQLRKALGEITPAAIDDAIIRLDANGVILCLDDFLGASRCTRHLDAIDLIVG